MTLEPWYFAVAVIIMLSLYAYKRWYMAKNPGWYDVRRPGDFGYNVALNVLIFCYSLVWAVVIPICLVGAAGHYGYKALYNWRLNVRRGRV